MIDAMCSECPHLHASLFVPRPGWKCAKDTGDETEHDPTDQACAMFRRRRNKSVSPEVGGPSPAIYIVSIGEETRKQCFYLLNLLRKANLSADIDYEGRSPRSQMRTANKLGVKYVIVLGPDELSRGDVKIKVMETSEEISLKQSEVLGWFLNRESPPKSYNILNFQEIVKQCRT